MKHVYPSVLPEHISREENDVWLFGAEGAEGFGWASRTPAKAFLSVGAAAMTGSQPSDLVVQLPQNTCTPTTNVSPVYSHLIWLYCREFWTMTVSFTQLTTDRSSAQQFSAQCHLGQKTGLGSELSGCDESFHAPICRSIILCRCLRLRIYGTTVNSIWSSIFTTLLGLIRQTLAGRESWQPKWNCSNPISRVLLHFMTVVLSLDLL